MNWKTNWQLRNDFLIKLKYIFFFLRTHFLCRKIILILRNIIFHKRKYFSFYVIFFTEKLIFLLQQNCFLQIRILIRKLFLSCIGTQGAANRRLTPLNKHVCFLSHAISKKSTEIRMTNSKIAQNRSWGKYYKITMYTSANSFFNTLIHRNSPSANDTKFCIKFYLMHFIWRSLKWEYNFFGKRFLAPFLSRYLTSICKKYNQRGITAQSFTYIEWIQTGIARMKRHIFSFEALQCNLIFVVPAVVLKLWSTIIFPRS